MSGALDQVTVALPDGSTKVLLAGSTAADLAASIGPGLAKAAIAAVVNGAEVDLTQPLPDGAIVSLITKDSEPGRHILRHSTAHVLAQAVCDLFPGAHYAIGPPIADGFYYDFELPGDRRFTDDDLEKIEARMAQIIAADQPFERAEHNADEAKQLFSQQPFKLEIIDRATAAAIGDGASVDDAANDDSAEGVGAGAVTSYRNTAAFVDLCRGPHVPSTARLGAFKLTKLAGAYWRGDEKRPMLQRIYGTAWESKQALDQHLARLAEAERRDHRKLGVELDLFSLPDELGGGLAVWHPRGARIRRLIEDFSRDEHDRNGYETVFTPHVAKSVLWETSGHLDFYADGMYPPMEMEGARYYPKPMNCPFHVLIYRSRGRSYRELPLRLFELGTVYRYERSGVLHGLLRARGFTQDDSHIFCTPEQLAEELASLLGFVVRILRTFGFDDFEAALATRPVGKSVGADDDWEQATAALQHAIDRAGIPHSVDHGGGAFYGPKIDVHVKDAIGRRWQLSTLQVDFQLPQRFDIEYTGADNSRHRPIMIHRALFGSVERFFGILVEHYAGAFPLWLAPEQVRVLPVRDDHNAYARNVRETLLARGFRSEVLAADEPLGARIRRAKLEKVPYVVVVGDDDVAHNTLGVNPRGGEVERAVAVNTFVERLVSELEARS
jgi:threonyl-tRNA synthetase